MSNNPEKSKRTTLYKYMSAATARIVLASSRLRWSSNKLFNDPFDMNIDLNLRCDQAIVRKFTLNKIWQSMYEGGPTDPANEIGQILMRYRDRAAKVSRQMFDDDFGSLFDDSWAQIIAGAPAVRRQVQHHIDAARVLCLTETPNNILMWSHYAANHTGIVIALAPAANGSSPWDLARPVRYAAELPTLADEELLSDILAGRKTFIGSVLVEHLIYTKSHIWAYERERRLVTRRRPGAVGDYEDNLFLPEEIGGIIFGSRALDEDIKAVCEIVSAKYPSASLMQAKLNRDAFDLEIVPFSS